MDSKLQGDTEEVLADLLEDIKRNRITILQRSERFRYEKISFDGVMLTPIFTGVKTIEIEFCDNLSRNEKE